MSDRIRVPLSVDAQPRVSIGPMQLPLRAVALLAAVLPLAFVCLAALTLPLNVRLSLAVTLLMLAGVCAAPSREGVWIGTWLGYAALRRYLPCAVIDGVVRRTSSRISRRSVRLARIKPPMQWAFLGHGGSALLSIPRARLAGDGLLDLADRGFVSVLAFDGPAGPSSAESYSTWCSALVTLLLSLDCPAQLVTAVSPPDPDGAQLAFDSRTAAQPVTPLLRMERAFVGSVAAAGVSLSHYAILMPRSAAADGIPHMSSLLRVRRLPRPKEADAREAAASLWRLAGQSGVSVRLPGEQELRQLIDQTVIGAPNAAVTPDGFVQVDRTMQAVVTVTRLPAFVSPGAILDAAIQAHFHGLISLHLMPVAAPIARRMLTNQLRMQRYLAQDGAADVALSAALSDTASTLASLAQRVMTSCRVACNLAVHDTGAAGVRAGVERLLTALSAQGFHVTVVTRPGLMPAASVAPGAAPLRRSLQLTSSDVASCLLPVLGTPLSDPRSPLLGLNQGTGSPVFLSIWNRANYNAVVLGSSGAGKSVAAKTLLVRHALDGAAVVVIDPDSEYRRVMNGINGRHCELGADSLNPLAPAMTTNPDAAAALALPVLTVMAGEERSQKYGRPVRRLRDEDQAWLYAQLVDFFVVRGTAHREPVLHEFIEHLTQSRRRATGVDRMRRHEAVVARLARYTQGDRGMVFDRCSSIRVGATPVAIGMRQLALAYAADLTPAFAVILGALLAALRGGLRHLIILVDEAHRITMDPDAGAVLAQLVRQARKHGAGVWLCSQAVHDFIKTDLGRTVAATSATKLLLGVEEAALGDVRSVFSLSGAELAALNPPVVGRGVLITGRHRVVVQVLPGPAVLALAASDPWSTGTWAGAAA